MGEAAHVGEGGNTWINWQWQPQLLFPYCLNCMDIHTLVACYFITKIDLLQSFTLILWPFVMYVVEAFMYNFGNFADSRVWAMTLLHGEEGCCIICASSTTETHYREYRSMWVPHNLGLRLGDPHTAIVPTLPITTE